MNALPRNTRSVPTSWGMSSAKCDAPASKELALSRSRRYVAIPHVLREVEMKPSDRAVLVSLLSFLPYSWDTLLAGRRLTFSRRSDEVAGRAGISVRSLPDVARRLSQLGLINVRSRGRLPSLWEVKPAAFGLPDDDFERRRVAQETKRRYVALPFSVVGSVSPSELAVLLEILAACGSRPYSRLEAGERLVATFATAELCSRSGMTVRTSMRAFESLRSRRLVDGDVRRGHWIVEVCPGMFGVDRPDDMSANLPNSPLESDKSAEQTDSLPITVHEGKIDRRGTRARAAALYAPLLTLTYGGVPRVTTPSMRGRVAQSALRLALADVAEAEVEREGLRLAREAGSPPRPESVVDAVLGRLAVTSLRSRGESQFTAATTCREGAETSVPEPVLPLELAATFDEFELRVWKWKAQLEAGDPAAQSFRDLLGGLLPWEFGYVPRGFRQETGRASSC